MDLPSEGIASIPVTPELYAQIFPPKTKEKKKPGRPRIRTDEERKRIHVESTRRWQEKNPDRVRKAQDTYTLRKKEHDLEKEQKLRQLEEENQRLKELEAENQRLKAMIGRSIQESPETSPQTSPEDTTPLEKPRIIRIVRKPHLLIN